MISNEDECPVIQMSKWNGFDEGQLTSDGVVQVKWFWELICCRLYNCFKGMEKKWIAGGTEVLMQGFWVNTGHQWYKALDGTNGVAVVHSWMLHLEGGTRWCLVQHSPRVCSRRDIMYYESRLWKKAMWLPSVAHSLVFAEWMILMWMATAWNEAKIKGC